MPFLYPLLFCGLLAVMAYQDFRDRAVSVWLLAVAFLVALANSVMANGWQQALAYGGVNLLLIAIQLLAVAAYFSLKHKAIVNIVDKYLGVGDLGFYAVLVCSFSPLNFVLFNLAACLLILIVYAIAGYRPQRGRSIPLAGGLAILLILVVFLSNVLHIFAPYDDDAVASLLFVGNH